MAKNDEQPAPQKTEKTSVPNTYLKDELDRIGAGDSTHQFGQRPFLDTHKT